jgi:hypothetical protein
MHDPFLVLGFGFGIGIGIGTHFALVRRCGAGTASGVD